MKLPLGPQRHKFDAPRRENPTPNQHRPDRRQKRINKKNRLASERAAAKAGWDAVADGDT